MIIAVVSYLLGSVSFAVIVTTLYKKRDIRNMGSGNAGATNVLRSVGKLPALLTTLGDLLKVFLSILFSRLMLRADLYQGLSVLGTYWAGFFCFLGHLYPVYFKFKGGKGVMTAIGMVFMIDWRIALLSLAVFAACLLTTRIVSLASIVAAIAYPIITFFIYRVIPPDNAEMSRMLDFFYRDQRGIVTLLAAVFAIMILIKHAENIKRLIKGQEAKISLRRSKEAN